MPTLDNYVSLTLAAERFDLSVRTLRRYIAEGRLPAYRIAGTHTIRVRVTDVQALLAPIPTNPDA